MKQFDLYKYLDEVRAKGRYSIIFDELKEKTSLSEKAIRQAIFRAKSKKIIFTVRKGFYIIIPPEYSSVGVLPLYLYIDDLMKFLKREYYIGLFSAAALYGAAHQQVMSHYIITHPPALRKISKEKLSIYFFTKKNWNKKFIVNKKTAGGYVKVSSPELTIFDLIYYHKKIGGINRIANVLEELSEIVNIDNFFEISKLYQNFSVIQRAGYIFDEVLEKKDLADILSNILKSKILKYIPLSFVSKNKAFAKNKKWKILINTEIDY